MVYLLQTIGEEGQPLIAQPGHTSLEKAKRESHQPHPHYPGAVCLQAYSYAHGKAVDG